LAPANVVGSDSNHQDMTFKDVAEDIAEGVAAVGAGAAAVAALPVELPLAATVGLTALTSYGAYRAEKGVVHAEQAIQDTKQIDEQRLNLQKRQYDLSLLEEDEMRNVKRVKQDNEQGDMVKNLKRNMSASVSSYLRPEKGPDNTLLHQPASSRDVVVYTRTENQGPGPAHIAYGSPPMSFNPEINQQNLVNLRSQAEKAISTIRDDWGFENATVVNHIAVGSDISKKIAEEMAKRHGGKFY
jgi:hypothetical protein